MSDTVEPAVHVAADPGTRRLAGVYAEALLNTTEKRRQTDEVLEELEALPAQVFAAHPHIEEFLSSGAVGRERKREVLEATLAGRANDLLVNFLHVLNDHDRLDLLRSVAVAARELYNQRKRRVKVLARTAVPLAEDQQERLKNELRTRLEMEPLLEMKVDPEILGGLIVQVEDYVYDASVRTRLEQIRTQTLERSSHEIQSGRDRFSS